MNESSEQPQPSPATLIRATLLALVVAMVLLITTILPIEYGVDPLGLGKALGFDSMRLNRSPAEVGLESETGLIDLNQSVLVRGLQDMKTDSLTVFIPAYEGVEVKAEMLAGQAFVFDWKTDGATVYTDMHGEPLNATSNEFSSYWKDKEQQQGNGMLLAGFDGTHGWYWQNMSEDPVTVVVTVSGFYNVIYEKE
jgi:hypothetical protein